MFLERLSPRISVTEMPVVVETTEMMCSTVMLHLRGVGDILQYLGDQSGVDGTAGEGGVCHDAGEAPFELADVSRHAGGDHGESGVVVDLDPLEPDPFPENGYAGLQIGRLDVRDEAPFEPRYEPVFQCLERFWRPVRGDDDLLAGLVERVEGVKELLLGLLLLLQELDVVDEKDVVGSVASLETFDGVVPQGVDEVVGEHLDGHVADSKLWRVREDVVSYRLEKMGLPKSHSPVDEERVVRRARGLGGGKRRGVGEPVRGPDDEVVERVFLVQTKGRAAW